MAQARCDVNATIPKQRVDESDNSSGNGESIRSSGGSDSLSLNLISGNGEQSRDDSIPTDDTHISTDGHRYYVREVTVSERDPASSHWETAHESFLNCEDEDNQGDDVIDPDINQPQMSQNTHLDSWLINLSNSHSVNDRPLQVTRGTQSGAGDGILGDPPTVNTRQNRTSKDLYYASAGQIPSIVKGLCFFVTVVCLLYGVGNVIQRLYHLEHQMMQSQVTFSQIQDAVKHLEHNQDHSIASTLPEYIEQPMSDISRPYSVFWGMFLFSIVTIVTVNALYNFPASGLVHLFAFHRENLLSSTACKYLGHQFMRLEGEIDDVMMQASCSNDVIRFIVNDVGAHVNQLTKICERIDKLEHGHDETVESFTAFDTGIKQQSGVSGSHNTDKDEILSGIQSKVQSLDHSVEKLLDIVGKTEQYTNQHQHSMKAMDTRIIQLEAEQNNAQDKIQKIVDKKVDQMQTQISVQHRHIEKKMKDMADKISDMTKEGIVTRENISKIDTKLRMIEDEWKPSLQTQLDTLAGNLAAHQSEVSTQNKTNQALQTDMRKVKKTMNSMDQMKSKYQESETKIDQMSTSIKAIESNISRLTSETQASNLGNIETAKKLTEVGKLIESQATIVNGLKSAHNTHEHSVKAMDNRIVQLEAEQSNVQDKIEKTMDKKFEQMQTQISVQHQDIEKKMKDMADKISDMTKEGIFTQDNISRIDTKLSMIEDEWKLSLETQLDTLAGNLTNHQSEVSTMNKTNQTLQTDIRKLKRSMNSMDHIKSKYQESENKIDQMSKSIKVIESNISRLTSETQESNQGNIQTAKKLTEVGKLIDSQTTIINGLQSTQNTALADVQKDVKILFQHKTEIERLCKQSEATHSRSIADIGTECKHMKAAILGLFMSLNTQIDKFVKSYYATDKNAALDVVPMMGLAWCSDQIDFRKDGSNECYTKAELIQKMNYFDWMNEYGTIIAIMKCMTGAYRTEMIQVICSNGNKLQAVLNDSNGINAICKAIESPDMGDEFFTRLAQTIYGLYRFFQMKYLSASIIESLLNRLNGQETIAFHQVYIVLLYMKNESYHDNISSKLKEQLQIKTCTVLKRNHSADVDKCLGWLCEKSSPELSHCAALLLWRLLQSDGSWVQYMKDKNSLVGLEQLVADPELNGETKHVFIQILGKCDILVSTNTCGSAMPPAKHRPPQKLRPTTETGSANLLSD